jgi:predicted phosphodiesterase
MKERSAISPCIAAALLVGMVCTPSQARDQDGVLALIQTPNCGAPALAQPGNTFEAVLTEQADLGLTASAGGVFPLTVSWQTLPGGMQHASCLVPQDAPPGTYGLMASVRGRSDVNVRSVYVFEAFPEAYAVAHVTDVHIGAEDRPRTSEAIFRDVIKTVNESGASIALFTGDLTHNGESDQFRRFLEILDTCILPTFVCPGNHDRQSLNYEQVFGPLVYYFWFGEDGYLAFDTKDYNTADDLGRQDADLQVFRRAIKPARWSIGFTHRYEPGMGMRSQIVLFLDNPLDFLVCGHTHRSNKPDETHVPWGTTAITITPAAIDGYLRLIEVTPRGIRPREPVRAPESP